MVERKCAFCEDRYHATEMEAYRHFLQSLLYIELNRVRVGVIAPIYYEKWSLSHKKSIFLSNSSAFIRGVSATKKNIEYLVSFDKKQMVTGKPTVKTRAQKFRLGLPYSSIKIISKFGIHHRINFAQYIE